MNKEPIDEMKEQLTRCSDAVIANTKIITPSDIKQDYFLHVAIKKNNEFIPYHSRIAAPSEDNTVPRIHVAPTLAGCIIATNQTHHLLQNMIPLAKLKDHKKSNSYNTPYLGGFYIHKVPFDVALKPSKKLVFDADQTGEHWLITYNQETRKYPAIVIGKVILSNLSITPTVGTLPLMVAKLLVEITDNDGIYLDKKNYLTKGYWSFELTDNTLISEVNNINKEVFDGFKDLSASLLSYQEPLACLKW